MNATLKALGLASLCVVLTGCPQLFDALFNSEAPQSLSATQGQGNGISLSWSEPNLEEGDERSVVSYDVSRDGSFLATETSTSYTDSSVPPAQRHSYTVSANFDDSSASGESSPASGWYVPGEPLELLTSLGGPRFGPGTRVTTDGWFRTLVVEGWTYHFDASGATTLSVASWDHPWNQVSLGSSTSFTWTADRTGKVWLKTAPARDLRGWYE